MKVTAPVERSSGAAAPGAARDSWIDNLRVVVIAGVIGAHVSMIYALDVGWYYEERTASAVTEVVLAAVFTPGAMFGMGMLFLVAGLFTPRAFDRKGPTRFVIDRLWRLALPAVVYLFVINPVMGFAGDRATGSTDGVAAYFRNTYWDDVSLGVAWFVAALCVFSVAYAAWRSRHPARTDDVAPLRRRDLLIAMAFIAGTSFVVRIQWPFLSTDEAIGLNLWEYPQMFALFVLGVLADERRWLAEGLPTALRRTCRRAAVVGVVSAALVGVVITVADDVDPFLGGLRVQAALIPLVEATITVSVSLSAVAWFRRRWNSAGAVVGAVSRGSFAAYLVHAPVTILLAVALRHVDVPAEVKLVTVLISTVVVSFGIGWLLTRGRTVGRVL